MSMMSTRRRLWRLARSAGASNPGAALAALFLMLVMLVTIGASDVAAAEPYGEVTRFGGAVKEFSSSSPEDEGKFVVPVGFAVEPQNPNGGEKNAVYVLDRTLSNTATGELDYRLQKISSITHEVLGSTTIEEKYTDKTNFSDVHQLIGLAVDPARKRVYAVECSMVQESGSKYVPVVGKLIAWSTDPEAATEKLVRAEPATLKEDTVTGASEVAGESSFKVSGGLSEVLYAPAGLAVESSTNGDVAIEAQAGVASGEGPTTIQLVEPSGVLGKHWTESHAVNGGEEWAGNGLFAGAAAEEFGADLYTARAVAPNLATVAVSTGTATEVETAATRGEDGDQALSISLSSPLSKFRPKGEQSFKEVVAAGSPVVQVTGADKLYASLFAHPGSEGVGLDDFQATGVWEVEENGKLETPLASWTFGSGQTEELGDIGIRLFELNGQQSKIVDTIGGGPPNSGTATAGSVLGSCNIDYRAASLAAGAEGAIFVLTQPRGESDDEVIEFAPGGQHRCPGVREASVEVKEGSSWKELQKGSEPEPSLTVDEGVPVTLSAESLDQVEANRTWKYTTFTFLWPSVYEWTPFGFEWNMEGNGYTVVNKIEGPEYKWPSPEVVDYTYQGSGIYHASVRVEGDYGTNEFPFLVHVLGKTPPEAKFTCKEAGAGTQFTVKAGKSLTCNATESKPTSGTEIEYYKWEFGDGTKPATETGGQKTHTFTKSGKYTITLEIHDKAGTPAENSTSHEVTVEAEEKATTTTSSSASQTSTLSSTTTTTTTKTSTSTTKVSGRGKKLTLHEELERALKGCKKDKPSKKRLSCEKTARKKYAPPKKKKASGKGKKSSKRK